jgi:multiple sugar transport system permease protein/raffinose/stachyose/melibiose transport system permease protein
MVWMVLASFKTRSEIFTRPASLPTSLSFDAYERAWSVGMGGFMVNSLIATALSVVVIVLASGMAAYALSRKVDPLKKGLYLLIVFCYAVPSTAVLVPLYELLSVSGMLNSVWAIVLPYSAYGIPFTTILFYAFFLDFPAELEEAARIDGCGMIRTFFSVIVPLSGPAVASCAIFQAVFIWNEFILALLSLTSPDQKTLPVGIMQLRGTYSTDWPAVMAGLTISVLPILAIFIAAQRYFVRSLAGLGK